MATTFADRQLLYRASVREFFADETRYARLERLLLRGDIGSLLYFFVKHFESDCVIATTWGRVRVCDEYRAALTNHKKRWFDFESREGHGELVWEGQVNPPVVVCEARGELAAPLPRLVALRWLVDRGLDDLLWERFDDVQTAHARALVEAKARYSEASRARRRSAARPSLPSGVSTGVSGAAGMEVCGETDGASTPPLSKIFNAAAAPASAATASAATASAATASAPPAAATRGERRLMSRLREARVARVARMAVPLKALEPLEPLETLLKPGLP
jgi:hypothetical protein